ncbi:MAG: hypothetical protein LUD74_00715, partial [Tannerellaceae bacterium]|nr:hypothetical protein [Tannerellaceae bacterium]
TSTQTITYRVNAPYEDASIYVVYMDSQGNVITETVKSGWSKEVTIQKGRMGVISAGTLYHAGEDENGRLCTAQILQDGKVVKEATSNNTISLYFP